MIAFKICGGPTCQGEAKPAAEFYKNKARKDGLSSQCKRCQSDYTGRSDVRARHNDAKSEWKKRNPEKVREKIRAWQRANPELMHAHAKRYRDSDKRECAIDGCTKNALSHTGTALCSLHQRRVYTHGDPYTVLPPPSGENHPRWVGDSGGYNVAHYRVKAARGKASEHRCAAGCGRQAEHWSYRGGAPDERTELVSPGGVFSRGQERAWYAPYSLDASFYDALCRSCHIKRDVWKKDVLA